MIWGRVWTSILGNLSNEIPHTVTLSMDWLHMEVLHSDILQTYITYFRAKYFFPLRLQCGWTRNTTLLGSYPKTRRENPSYLSAKDTPRHNTRTKHSCREALRHLISIASSCVGSYCILSFSVSRRLYKRSSYKYKRSLKGKMWIEHEGELLRRPGRGAPLDLPDRRWSSKCTLCWPGTRPGSSGSAGCPRPAPGRLRTGLERKTHTQSSLHGSYII